MQQYQSSCSQVLATYKTPPTIAEQRAIPCAGGVKCTRNFLHVFEDIYHLIDIPFFKSFSIRAQRRIRHHMNVQVNLRKIAQLLLCIWKRICGIVHAPLGPLPYKEHWLIQVLLHKVIQLDLRGKLEYDPRSLRFHPPILLNWSIGCFEFCEVSQVISTVCQLIWT